MGNAETRDLLKNEHDFIADVLRRLREHFHQWPGYEGDEHDLISFAFYEGCGGSDCCGQIIGEAAPFALGSELVREHGSRWVMLARDGSWRYAVHHPSMEHPIDLLRLEDGEWDNEERDEPPDPGERTFDSLESIVKHVGGRLET